MLSFIVAALYYQIWIWRRNLTPKNFGVKIQERTGKKNARFTPPLPHPFIKAVLPAFIKILTLTAYLLTKEHKHTRAGYIEKHWMLITSTISKIIKSTFYVALLLVPCFWLLLGCNLQPFALIGCNLLRCVYHSGGFQKLLEASFYKGAENHNHFINVGVFAALM